MSAPLTPPANAWIVARAIVTGLAVAFAGIAPWLWLAPINARVAPEWPWAALAVFAWLGFMLWWLNGGGWPRVTRAFRNSALRLWPPDPDAWRGEKLAGTLGLMAIMAGIYVFWIVATAGQPTPDLSVYPTTAYLISIVLMGAFVSGVVEEMAFRGYMQSQLERFGLPTAIAITSIVFALSHLTHGLQALLIMAPGYIMASILYGLLAYRTGSILPGMAIHVLGDASHTFFAILGGNASLLVC